MYVFHIGPIKADIKNTKMKTFRDIQNEDAMIEAILESNSIGELIRNGSKMFYAIRDGVEFYGATRLHIARQLLAYANRA